MVGMRMREDRVGKFRDAEIVDAAFDRRLALLGPRVDQKVAVRRLDHGAVALPDIHEMHGNLLLRICRYVVRRRSVRRGKEDRRRDRCHKQEKRGGNQPFPISFTWLHFRVRSDAASA